MAGRDAVVKQQIPALEEIRDLCEELDPEGAKRLTRYVPGGVIPTPTKRPAEYSLFITEAVLILARALQKRKGGRPRNVARHDEDTKPS
jgi:hypothetical protein